LKEEGVRLSHVYRHGDPKHPRANQTPLRLVAKGQQPERRQLKMRTNSLPNRYRKYAPPPPPPAAPDPPAAPPPDGGTGYGRLLIVLGDGSFRHNMRGHASTSTAKRIFQELSKLGEMVRWVDEHRTSKCCSSCGEEMEQAVLVKRPQETRQAQSKGCLKRAVRKATLAAGFAAKHGLPDPPPAAAPPPPRADATHPAVRDDGRHAYVARTRFRTGDAFPSPSDAGAYDRRQLLTPWGLKYCSNCNRLWSRDKNATHIFFSRMVFLLAQPKGAVADAVAESRQDGPGYLCRQVRQEQVDGPAPKSKRVAKRNRDGRAVDVKADAECEDAIAAPDAAAIVAPSKSNRCKLTSPDQQLLDNECV
ncbi:hypothetical protein V1506DRAFT_526388, partial [Lipomyces tetrasporus]